MPSSSLPAELPEWIRNHIARYLESDGADGHLWDSSVAGGKGMVPTLLLTTTGRKSGKSLLLPLIYGKTDEGYAIVASKGGAPTHPAWYLNLSANADVHVQVAAEKFRAKARVVSGEERAKIWSRMVEIYPPYTEYQARTKREIPVVVLEPVTG